MKIYKITYNVVFQDDEHGIPHVTGDKIFFLSTGDVVDAGLDFKKKYLAKGTPNGWKIKEFSIPSIEWFGEVWAG